MSQVSAIVSAYYAGQFIDRRLDNLLAQQPQPEIIVVARRGSVEAQSTRRHGLRPIETEDIPTLYAAWNLAARAARGDYLVSANCDDLFEPGALAEMAAVLDNRPDIAVVYGNVREVDGRSGSWRFRRRSSGGMEVLLRRCFPGPMPMWRRYLHGRYGGFDETFRVAGDYEFWLRLAAAGETFLHLDRLVGVYLRRVESLEHRDPHLTQLETDLARQRYPQGAG